MFQKEDFIAVLLPVRCMGFGVYILHWLCCGGCPLWHGVPKQEVPTVVIFLDCLIRARCSYHSASKGNRVVIKEKRKHASMVEKILDEQNHEPNFSWRTDEKEYQRACSAVTLLL